MGSGGKRDGKGGTEVEAMKNTHQEAEAVSKEDVTKM